MANMLQRNPISTYAAPVRARWAKVRIETEGGVYTGRLYVPETKRRVSDMFSDERMFLNLTEVSVNHSAMLEPFVAINKSYIRTIRVIDDGQPEPAARS